ncbi:hypothetical protein [Xanthomonas pisi]|uniref:hypothetical protein n=1 Tax=Xanthomonas pisi TaxID=56457 RepID=UPI000B284A91|nr:hypothetical protein [Xanthomonas pisi]
MLRDGIAQFELRLRAGGTSTVAMSGRELRASMAPCGAQVLKRTPSRKLRDERLSLHGCHGMAG